MRSRRPGKSRAIRPGAGSWNWKTAGRSAPSMCNGVCTRWPRNISATRMRKPTGCSKAGATRWMLCLTNPKRCSGAWIGSARNGCSTPSGESENLTWKDPWLQSLDLEYHNIDPARGLFFGLQPAKRIGEWNNLVRQKDAARTPPVDTRASGRAKAVAAFRKGNLPYVINWDSIACETHDCLVMGNPFQNLPRRGGAVHGAPARA